MFILDQSESYYWPVVVEVAQSGGRYEKHSFECLFKRISDAEFKEYIDKAANKELTDKDICKQVVLGWKGIQEAKEEVPFTITSLEKVLNVPQAANAIAMAFLDSVTGIKRKNS